MLHKALYYIKWDVVCYGKVDGWDRSTSSSSGWGDKVGKSWADHYLPEGIVHWVATAISPFLYIRYGSTNVETHGGKLFHNKRDEIDISTPDRLQQHNVQTTVKRGRSYTGSVSLEICLGVGHPRHVDEELQFPPSWNPFLKRSIHLLVLA